MSKGNLHYHFPTVEPVRLRLFSLMQYTARALLAAVFITMELDTKFWNVSWIVGVPWLVLVSAALFSVEVKPT